jgi:hypothetical protein
VSEEGPVEHTFVIPDRQILPHELRKNWQLWYMPGWIAYVSSDINGSHVLKLIIFPLSLADGQGTERIVSLPDSLDLDLRCVDRVEFDMAMGRLILVAPLIMRDVRQKRVYVIDLF